MRMLLLLGLFALVSGCATKQAATTYWTTKGGVVVVHHVVGKLDTTEKLEQKQLSEDKLKAVDLPKENYFEVVEGHDQVISRPAPRKNTEKPKKDNLAEVTSQIRDLKRQVQAVQAQNQRLQEQLAAPTSEKTAQQDHPDGQDPDVRLSQ